MELAVQTSIELPHEILLRFPDGTRKLVSFAPTAMVPRSWAESALATNPKVFKIPDANTKPENYKFSDKFKNQGLIDIYKKLSPSHQVEIVELAKSLYEDELAPPITAGKVPAAEETEDK